MANDPKGPADTTMMRIVHDAVRRDLARARAALGDPSTSAEQQLAIGAHLRWLMGFLHAHPASEDHGLYPLLRQRGASDPKVAAVLDRMAGDHEAIAAAMSRVDPACPTVDALDRLADVLLPHLHEEETEAMPIASGLVTNSEWLAIEKEHNLDPKSTAELGFEGHWLIDGATDADRAIVLGLVPPVQRFFLLHGFARRYRRHAGACWGAPMRPPRRIQLENRVEVTVAADIDDVWAVVCDVTRVGEWSGECIGAEWLDGARSAVPGARFRGRNRSGSIRWGRTCEVQSADPYELVFRIVPTTLHPDSAEWRITLRATAGGGTTITESFRALRAPKILMTLYAVLVPAHRDRTTALVEDLTRLGAVAALAERVPPRAQRVG